MFHSSRWVWLAIVLGGCGWRNRPFPAPLSEGTVGRSNLVLPADSAFLLGGNQSGALTVQVSLVRGTIVLEGSEGEQQRTVQKGESAILQVSPGEAAIIRSTARRALIKVTTVQTSDERLGMVFADPGEELRMDLIKNE